MKKSLLRMAFGLLLLAGINTSVSAAVNDDEEETLDVGLYLFHFNRDKTALELWFCNRTQAEMTLPDKVYYDAPSKKASLTPFGSAKAYNVEKLDDRTFWGDPNIVSITLPASYRLVGSIVFKNCPNLKTFVAKGKGVIFGDNLFVGCKALENVTMDASQIGPHIFNGCERLVNPHITGTLDYIPDAAFHGCGVRNLDFLPQSVNKIWAGAFTESKLEGDLVIPNRINLMLNGAFSLTNIRSVRLPEGLKELCSSMFGGCGALTKVTLPEGLRSIGSTAFSATALKNIDLPNSVKELSVGAFYNCFNFDSIHLSNQLTRLEMNTFYNTALKHIYLPASINQIDRRCFDRCKQLTDIYCFSTIPPTADDQSFYDYDKPTVHVPAGTLAKYKSAPAWKKFRKFKEMPIGAGIGEARQATLNAYRTGDAVHVTGVANGCRVQVYTLGGQLVGETIAHGSEATLQGIGTWPVIVKAGKLTQKLE